MSGLRLKLKEVFQRPHCGYGNLLCQKTVFLYYYFNINWCTVVVSIHLSASVVPFAFSENSELRWTKIKSVEPLLFLTFVRQMLWRTSSNEK